jgi:hypothetical protein
MASLVKHIKMHPLTTAFGVAPIAALIVLVAFVLLTN